MLSDVHIEQEIIILKIDAETAIGCLFYIIKSSLMLFHSSIHFHRSFP